MNDTHEYACRSCGIDATFDYNDHEVVPDNGRYCDCGAYTCNACTKEAVLGTPAYDSDYCPDCNASTPEYVLQTS